MDPEVLKQLEEDLRQLESSFSELNKNILGSSSSVYKNTGYQNQYGEGFQKLINTTGKANQAIESFKDSLLSAAKKVGESLFSFSSSLISGKEGFAKYAESISKLNPELGKVAGLYLEQADNLLKASDSFARMGAAGTLTTEEIRKIGAGAGLASFELDKLIKPMQSLKGGLLGLGGSATEGIKRFGEMAAVSKEVRQEFKRLGMGDQERNQAMADFVSYMNQTGAAFTGSLKTQQGLQKAAVEYTRNLYELAELTGKDVDSVREQQQVAMSTMEVALAENKWAQEKIAAEKRGDKAAVERIEREQKGFKSFTNELIAAGATQDQIVAAQNQFLTGAITEQSAKFQLWGLNMDEYIKKHKDGTASQGELANAYVKTAQNFTNQVGVENIALSKNLQQAGGYTKEFVGALTQRSGIDLEAKSREAHAEVIANQNNESKAALDIAQQNRQAMTEFERTIRLTTDDFIAMTNPLTKVNMHFEALEGTIQSLINTLTENFKTLVTVAGVLAGTTALAGLVTTVRGAIDIFTTLKKVGFPGGGGGGVGGGGVGGGGVGGGGVRALKFMAISAGLGYATDAAFGATGVGKGIDVESLEKQDEENWKKMTLGEKFQSGLPRGIEKAGKLLFLDNLVNEAAKSRVESETSYLNKMRPSTMPAPTSLGSESGKADPKSIAAYLKTKGLSDVQIAGILGNIERESSFNPAALGDKGTSGGLFQHHNERFAKMQAMAGSDWSSNWKGQIDYALTEPEMKKFLSKNYSSSEEAAKEFAGTFEKPANLAFEKSKRAALASKYGDSASVSNLIASKETPKASTTATQARASTESGNELLMIISQKLDVMISELAVNNDITTKILRQARI